jgi:hypothetical protein
MTESSASSPAPVTAYDLERAVFLAVDTLRQAHDADWQAKAGSLEWTCWETVEHLADDLFQYATQLGPRVPPMDDDVPFDWQPRRPGGPSNIVYADPDAGPDGLLQVLEASGALLVSMVRTKPPEVLSYHGYGASDPEGFAAMGTVETIVHLHDIAAGLGLSWEPPGELCDRVLYRLFPDAPADPDRWRTLLWATGRADLPGHERRTTWRWNGTPR